MPEAAAPAAALTQLPGKELFELACQSERSGDLERAARLLDHLLASNPRDAEAHHLRAVVAYRGEQFGLALEHAEEAFKYGHDTPRYWRNIAEYFRCLGRYDEALVAGHKAVTLNPNDSAVWHNCGLIEAEHHHINAAIACFERALSLDPNNAGAHFGLAEALLGLGKFRRGWDEYQWRFRLPGVASPVPFNNRPVWDGSDLPGGALLLVADQGAGDCIQFARYLPWAKRKCERLFVAASPELRSILQEICPGAHVFSNWNEAPQSGPFATMSGLPRLAGTKTLETIPNGVPYLRADQLCAQRWRARLESLVPRGLKRIGIVWAGNPTHRNDRKRSISLDDLAPLAERDDLALVVLQKGAAQRQAGRYYGRAPLVNLSAEIATFEDTMAIMDGLDLVLSVDTSVAHLAGAMGLPLWILLPWAAEWRWLHDRPDTPWYPTARLFRQPTRGDWAGAVREVVGAL